MRFQRIRIDAFGRLTEVDTGPEPLPGLVVVTGPNEAGKSTFFGLLTSLLYGFYPASRDRNEYAPWSGTDASGSAVIRLSGGEEVEVERRLLSSPAARLRRNGTEEKLRNESLPWVKHVPRAVFGQVFALTLRELAGLDEETWGRVQDRLLGAMGSEDLRPAREVAGELEQEAGQLWRPNRRGNQRIRALRTEVRELRARRREAVERDAEIRRVTRRRDQARARLAEAREERERGRLAVERVQSLLPLRTRLRRIDELEATAGPAAELDGLPSDPGRELARREAELEELEGRLAEGREEMKAPRRTAEALDEDQRALLQRRRTVAEFTARAGSWAADRSRLRDLVQEIRDLERRLATVGQELLATGWDDAPRGPLLAVSPKELRAAVREARSARDDERARRLAAEAPDAPDPTLRWAGLALLAAGAVLAAAAALAPVAWMALPALLLAGAGAALLLRHRGRAETRSRDRVAAARETGRRATEARDRVASLLRDVPVAPDRLDEPDEALVASLERMQELLRDREERRERARELEADLARADRDGRTLAATLGRDPGMEAETLAGLLDRELRRAEQAESAAASAQRELARMEREVERLARDRDERREERDALRRRLAALGEGDPDRGLGAAERRLEARERARGLREELRRSHPELETLRERIDAAETAGESWTRDDEELARQKAGVETLGEEIEELTAETERLDHELRRLLEEDTVDVVDSEIDTLEEEEGRLLRERDRRWVLACLVREADRRFREEHQPDLLRRASAWLEELTGGRYHRLVADDGGGEHRFHLAGGDRNELTPLAPPVSTGTLEQAYLALRLAIVDHLDEGRERLPLFVDEALVNWDPARRERGLAVLSRLSRDRQVFFFTCHPRVAEALEELGARRVELGPA